MAPSSSGHNNKNKHHRHLPLAELQTYRYNQTVNIQQAVMQDENGTAQCVNKRITVLPATLTQTIPCLLSQPLVLIVPTHEGMARLSQP